MQYEEIHINNYLDENVKHVLDNSLITYVTEHCSGYISGGFARKVYLRENLSEYLSHGDIDIYFHSFEGFKKAEEYFEKQCVSKYESITGSCSQYTTWLFDNPYVKVQLVKAFTGTPLELFKSFDFTNNKIALHGSKIIYDKSISDLDFHKRLDINNSNSPFLMSRIYKYMKYRGYESITNSSRDHITAWLVKANQGFWDSEKCGVTWFDGGVYRQWCLPWLIANKELITDTDLLLLLGKVIYREQQRVSNYQSVFETKDVAREELSNRSNN
tara:strand:- start:7071 stop:7886 length:816 start_codon:yes stop_codon:yes gene_type:complete